MGILKLALHTVPHAMPAGVLLTLPLPFSLTVAVKGGRTTVTWVVALWPLAPLLAFAMTV